MVECHVGVIKAMACAVSYDAGFWPLMWLFAMEAACRRLQHSRHVGPCQVTPHQLDYGAPPRASFFALWGAWFTTTATQLVTPRCVSTALALSLVFLLVLTRCPARTRSIPC